MKEFLDNAWWIVDSAPLWFVNNVYMQRVTRRIAESSESLRVHWQKRKTEQQRNP